MRKAEMANVEMRKIAVKDLNDFLVCTLCGGYFVDATSLSECHHTFCRGCILRYFENCKAACPTCNCVYKKKNQVIFKADPQIQAIVYKVVPGLYSKEMQRREDFYRSTGVRASSSCSDDSVLERELNEEDSMVTSQVGDKNKFFGPEDSISLSLEYYQVHLDTTREDVSKRKPQDTSASDKHKVNGATKNSEQEESGKSERRFLQCPAAVTMKHLQKFVRMKYALSPHHKVDIIFKGEVLPPHFGLMDVAYTFNWKRVKPLRFFYRIFTPLKIHPIKIVSTGDKQLQVVSPSTKTEVKNERPEESEEKERLLANLQLQSRTKVQNHEVPDKVKPVQDCVFDYEEQDKEEIKRFAEIRDREWAMQKKLDESKERERDDDYHHFSKKRKKNKHSKSEFVYKKRKLHAEITNKEEDLKLKVKLTQHNGHKHKHHKSSQQQVEMSSKEKLLQMRQVRHKHVSSEDKNVQTVPSGSVSKETSTETGEEKKESRVEEVKPVNGVSETSDAVSKLPTKTTIVNKVPTVQIERNEQTEEQAKKTFPKSYQVYAEKVQKVVEVKQIVDKPKPIVDKPKPTLDKPKAIVDKPKPTLDKPKAIVDKPKPTLDNPKPIVDKSKPILDKPKQVTDKLNQIVDKTKQQPESAKISPSINLNRASQLERKIANLQQRCTIETKKPVVVDKPKTTLPQPQYPAGFTVSKIESGVKRKLDSDEAKDKRPSLEITLINPTPSESNNKTPTKAQVPQTAKRPPPATIPLDRIKKSFNFKSGISIIPKPPEKCDNIGALDLSSKPSKEGEATPTTSTSTKPVNGFASPAPKEGKNANMSNLQMLSKVASEHPSLNKSAKIRPQMPNLQTLKIPTPNQRALPNLDKLPKLINKHQFRLLNPQIRNLRPNQNQSIRNIPNPSLLVRQQQNRLNSMNPVKENNNAEKEKAEPPKISPEPKPAEGKEAVPAGL